MVKLTTRERVIFALIRKEGLLNKELIKEAKTNHNSLSIVLKQLQKEKIIVKEDDKYYFSTELEHPSLKALGSAFTVLTSLDRFGEMLETVTDPFKEGVPKISELATRRSLVIPSASSTIARRLPIIRLKRADLPTLGRPTMAIFLKVVIILP